MWPPAFTFNNKMYQVPKSQLNKRIKTLTNVPETADDMDMESVPVKQLVIDLSMVTVMMSRVINLNKVNTFQKFFDKVWDYIYHLGFYHRVNIGSY